MRNSFGYHGWGWSDVLGALIFLIFVGLIGLVVYEEVTNPCVEWEETGGFTCFGDQGFQTCSPDKRCVRRMYK